MFYSFSPDFPLADSLRTDKSPKLKANLLISDERGFDFQIIQIAMQLLGFLGWLLCITRYALCAV